MTSLVDVFLTARSGHAERPALWVEGRTLSYEDLHFAAAQLASAIETLRHGDPSDQPSQCGLLVNRTTTAYAGVLASLMAGSAYVPLNPRFPTRRLLDILAVANIDTLVVDHRSVPAAIPLLEECPRRMNVLLADCGADEEWLARAPKHRYLTKAEIARCSPKHTTTESKPEDGAYLLFTSGSTGVPKGVLVSHRNALTYVTNAAERFRPGPEDRFSQLFDFSFDLSVHDMFVAWRAGACLYCAPEGGLAGLGAFIRRHSLTFWLSVPSTAAFMRQMRMLKPNSYPTLRWSLFCGEALPMSLALAWRDAAPNSIVENLYGPTEATVAFTAYRLPNEIGADLQAQQSVPIGTPLPDQKVAVVDEEGTPLPEGEVGELCLGGSQVAAGYWRAPERTAEHFRGPRDADATGVRWYRTGDLAVMSKDHGLIYRGRIDRQAKIGGYRVELIEVENAMRAAAGTDTVAAVPSPTGDGGLALSLVGFVSGTDRGADEIMEGCRALLPNYMVPTRIYEIPDWPINANGKTDYNVLTARLKNADV